MKTQKMNREKNRDASRQFQHQRLWFYRLLVLAMIAAGVHFAVVWVVPRAIMQRVMDAQLGDQVAGVYFPPMTDASQRRIVMPSPDLLYALCTYDLSQQPLHIQANPQWPHYWSVALYASNSDNFMVLNDTQAAGQGLNWLLLGPQAYAQVPVLPPGAKQVFSPSQRGLLLMRVLVSNYEADRERVEAARRTLRCQN